MNRWQLLQPIHFRADTEYLLDKANKLKHVLTGSCFVELPVSADVVSQIATIEKIHDQIKILSILECVVHIDEEWTIELSEDLSFVHYTLYASFRQYSGFTHFLHGIFMLELFAIDLPYFSETTFSITKTILKTGLAYCYRNS